MIPKIIHYCWFGRNPLPDSAKKCIASWKKFFPDYEIREWNEDTYDIAKIPYIREAYKAKKYAFVSDYARFDILYNVGGVYFDTDVEVIRPMDDILEKGAFMGCEIDGKDPDDPADNAMIAVAPGLGLAAEKGHPLYQKILDYYADQHFLVDGAMNTETVVSHVTRVLFSEGLENKKGIQTVAGITVYPKEYFNPRNNNTGVMTKTKNTRAIHWYSMTWLSKKERRRSQITRLFHRLFGEDCFSFLKKQNR